MAANYINFVNELIYGDMGNAELGASAPSLPAGALNHLRFTLTHKPSSGSTTITGQQFLSHHLDYMLTRFEAWLSKYFLPPLRPWNGQDVFPGMPPAEGPTMPASLSGGPFPAGWTIDNLGNELRNYYNAMRNYSGGMEMDIDEIKAPHSYRYWAFAKWMSDIRKRFLAQPVFPVSTVFDRDGIVLTAKDFTDIFYMVHHVWHPDGPVGSGWTVPTPYFKTSVGQHIGKKEISRTQIGAEFFAFHRDHLELFDRWLSRTGQDAVQSINTCAHDTSGGGGSVPAGVEADFSGNPKITWSSSPTNPTVNFNPVHNTDWNGNLGEFSNPGLMGQLFALDFNQFALINVPVSGGGNWNDMGYHGEGHVLNGDLYYPVPNNFVPRFFAWHGFIDDIWTKRRPDFNVLDFVLSTDAAFTAPQVVIIVRDLNTNTDAVEPSNAIAAVNLSNGQGTVKVKLNVRTDPFGRPLELKLRCDILREAVNNVPLISISRDLIITPGAPANTNERQQNTDFVESFVFDGSAGTVDAAGEGPFISDNLVFTPTATGFKNSLVRITAYLTCSRMANGNVAPVSGTISSSGLTVNGSGTLFSTQFNEGDLIRANGQVRAIATIANNTSLTLLEAFSANLPAGTAYQRLDGFDFEKVMYLPLIQEKQAPEITAYLNLSSFSKDQVDAISSGGQSVFDNAFYVVLQDRTSRAATIFWPAEVEPQLRNLIAPPVYCGGLYTDTAHQPLVELRDLADNPVPGVVVSITSISPESPSQHPAIPQRVTFTCRVTFTGTAAFTGMVAGDMKDMKLVITAVDRCGNRVVDESKRVRLQINANPYMLDGPTSWLSIDTRVLRIQQGVARFGVLAGWSNPNTFIQQVIQNFRTGNGTAGGESFDSLPTDQEGSFLEYSTSINGVNYYNFALAKVRLQSLTGAVDVRASFRFFRWGTANVEFDNTLAYRSAPGGIALLGRTSTNELASIPFFAEPRVPVTSAMTTQTDPGNLFSFGPTGGGEATSYFGAYLDINQSVNRFPNTFTGDGGFSGTLYSIRNLLMGNHQCMVVEVVFAGDPTVNGATPGTSDNLSQRNLLIVQTANPGDEITRTVQHLFNIDLTRKRRHVHLEVNVDDEHGGHEHDGGHIRRHAAENKHLNAGANCCEPVAVLHPHVDTESPHGAHFGVEHLKQGWLGQFPEKLKAEIEKLHKAEVARNQWQFDAEIWKSTTGLDELVFLWNNLPKDSVVEVFMPEIPVTEIFNYRNLRHAPGTVRIVNENTLRLFVEGTTYLPVPSFYGDNIAGLITIQLPKGIKKGQRYRVDVLQVRADESRTLGGFQLNIQVEKAIDIMKLDGRWLELFHKRLSLTAKTNRWYPILQKQVEFARLKAKGMADLARTEHPSDSSLVWTDPTENKKGQPVRVVLEKIRILEDREPFFKGRGEFRFYSKVYSPDNGGRLEKFTFPEKGHFKLGDKSGQNEVIINRVIFDDFVNHSLLIQIGGLELDTFDPDDRLCTYKRHFHGNPEEWIGIYAQHSGEVSIEQVGGWNVWYSIEYSG